MKTLAKTKIIRLPGLEVYFQKVQFENGEIRWRPMERDVSALMRGDHDSKFRGSNCVQRDPRLNSGYAAPIAPLPANFADDLLTPYAALSYAVGHEPKLMQW